MQHRNIITDKWSRMAIESLFERGKLPDWREFAQALSKDEELASNTLFICDHHSDQRSAALARALVEHFHPSLAKARTN